MQSAPTHMLQCRIVTLAPAYDDSIETGGTAQPLAAGAQYLVEVDKHITGVTAETSPADSDNWQGKQNAIGTVIWSLGRIPVEEILKALKRSAEPRGQITWVVDRRRTADIDYEYRRLVTSTGKEQIVIGGQLALPLHNLITQIANQPIPSRFNLPE